MLCTGDFFEATRSRKTYPYQFLFAYTVDKQTTEMYCRVCQWKKDDPNKESPLGTAQAEFVGVKNFVRSLIKQGLKPRYGYCLSRISCVTLAMLVLIFLQVLVVATSGFCH